MTWSIRTSAMSARKPAARMARNVKLLEPMVAMMRTKNARIREPTMWKERNSLLEHINFGLDIAESEGWEGGNLPAFFRTKFMFK
jgi:hypothetical protein